VSDVDVVLSALPRILQACRARDVTDPAGSGVVSAHQARILSCLDAVDPTMVTELADFMGVTPSTMSLNLKRLREAGFVTAERDPADRRVKDVRLTEAGVRMRESAAELDRSRVEAVLHALRPDERTIASRGLTVLAESADRLAAAAVPSTVEGPRD